jgi:hypothetical protein
MTDTFRKEYKQLSQFQKTTIACIKEKAEDLLEEMESSGVGEMNTDKRYMALAKTNLEQAVMWAIKAIT